MSDETVRNCGYYLYGPPCICTCGLCDDDAERQREAAAEREDDDGRDG